MCEKLGRAARGAWRGWEKRSYYIRMYRASMLHARRLGAVERWLWNEHWESVSCPLFGTIETQVKMTQSTAASVPAAAASATVDEYDSSSSALQVSGMATGTGAGNGTQLGWVGWLC